MAPAEPLDVAILIIANDPAGLESIPGLDPIKARRVQEGAGITSGFDAILAALFLDPVETSDSIVLPLNNPGSDTIIINDIQVIAVGEHTGRSLPLHPAASPPIVVGPGYVPRLVLELDRNGTEADRYTGAVLIEAMDPNRSTSIPLELQVRIAPTLPLALIMLGLILGAGIKWILERGRPLLKEIGRRDELRERLALSRIPVSDKKIVLDLLDEADVKISALQAADAHAVLDKASERLDVLSDVYEIARKHPGKQTEVHAIRLLVKSGNMDEAKKKLQELKTATTTIATIRTPEINPGGGGLLQDALRIPAANISISRRFAMTFVLTLALVVALAAQWAGWIDIVALARDQPALAALIGLLLVGLLILLLEAGVARLARGNVAWLWYSERLVTTLLLTGLIILGMHVLYVQGATGLAADYISPVIQFVVWGFGSEVASRSVAAIAKK